jgi:hypothetical protein
MVTLDLSELQAEELLKKLRGEKCDDGVIADVQRLLEEELGE